MMAKPEPELPTTDWYMCYVADRDEYGVCPNLHTCHIGCMYGWHDQQIEPHDARRNSRKFKIVPSNVLCN